MKKIRLLFTLLLLTVIGTAQAESISVSDVSLTPGSQAELVINCEFSSDNITLYQFDLYLPEGVTPAYDESEDEYICELSSRHKKSHQLALTDNVSFYRVVVSSNTNKLIAAGSGELLRITVNVASSVSGTLQASIKNFSMFETNETEHPMSDVTFNMVAPSVTVLATGVTLNQSNLTLTSAGQTASLTATVSPSNASNKNVTWSSSNPSVASVSNGVVRAVANGTATITATTADGSNKTATCAVTVNIPVKATGVNLNQTSLTLTSAGQTATLQATVSPSNASNKNVTWSSSNPSVATVSNGVVTAVANGTATITVRTLDGSNKTATCAVTVNISSGDNPAKKVIGTIGEPITSVSDLVNGGTYLITSVGRHANDGIYLYEDNDHYLLFESVAEGHDANAALTVEVIDGSHIYIKTQSGYYIPPYADPRGKFMLSNTEKEPLLIEAIDGVEGQFTLAYTTYAGGSTAYPNASTIYLDADLANISNWGSRCDANGNGAFRFVPVTLIASDIPDDQITGTITYIGSPITSVSEINANSYYLLTSVGRHGSDGKYLYEKNLSVKTSELNFEVVNVGHDANAAFQFEPAGNNQFRIKTTSGNYVPIAQTTGWFAVSADNPGTFLIEPIEDVDNQFTLSCVGTAYYLDANAATASMWNTKSSANGNGAYRIVYCEIERTTAIDNIIDNPERNTDKSVYTIQGQRVTDTRNLRPGVYIIGGKKVLIK